MAENETIPVGDIGEEEKPTVKIEKYFGKVSDPHVGKAKRHKFMGILVIAILTIIYGADSWVDVELFAKSKEKWLKTFLDLPHGIPSHNTIGRVFAKINQQEFGNAFLSWVQIIQALTQSEEQYLDFVRN